MIFWVVEDEELVKYERVGVCTRCGECCCDHLITFRLRVDYEGEEDEDDSSRDWSGWEGFSIFRAQGLLWYMKAERGEETRICSDLDVGGCGIWMQNDFPAVCRYWPIHPDNLEYFPNCGFSFRRGKG